jgi:hypothetical protein
MSLATAEWCVTYLQRFYSTAEDPHYIPLLNEKRAFTSLQSCRNCASGSILDVFGVRGLLCRLSLFSFCFLGCN